MVSLGWLHFNIKRNIYVLVRANSSVGASKINFENTVKDEKILHKAKLFHFGDKYFTIFGKMKDMDNNLRDFLKEEGNYEVFSSLAKYIKSSSFLKTYLCPN